MNRDQPNRESPINGFRFIQKCQCEAGNPRRMQKESPAISIAASLYLYCYNPPFPPCSSPV